MKYKIVAATIIATTLFCLTLMAESDEQYQSGKIVSVEKLPAQNPTTSGSDAPADVSAQVDRYNVGIQIGDTIYKARWKIYQPSDLDWVVGREVQVRPKGNVMYLKRHNGQILKASIVGKTKAKS
jgi:hypothetical protein